MAAAGAGLAVSVALPAAAATQTLSGKLASGTKASFTTTSGGGTGITCTTSTVSLTVSNTGAVTNAVSLTSLAFSSCAANITGVTGVNSVSASGLPWTGSLSGSNMITFRGSPAGLTVSLKTIVGNATCAYQASSVVATGNLVAGGSLDFAGQQFSLASGPSLCPADLFMSADYDLSAG